MSKYARIIGDISDFFSDRVSQFRELPKEIQQDFIGQLEADATDTGLLRRFIEESNDIGYEVRPVDEFNFGVFSKSDDDLLMDGLSAEDASRVAEQYNVEEAINLSYELPDEVLGAMTTFDQGAVEGLMPSIMGRITAPAAGGVVVGGGLLAPEDAMAGQTPQQISSLLAVPAEIGSALNEAVVGTLDFIGPDTINAVSQLAGSQFRVPRLSDQELVRRYTQGGYMGQGVPRDVVRTATGLLSPL